MEPCSNPCPGYLAEPYHLPGYSGHVPTIRSRNGGTYGRLTHDVLEDPCVPQAPIPVLQAPCTPCGGDRNNGCIPPAGKPSRRACQEPPTLPCAENNDPRAHHLNRSPYACSGRPEPDIDVYRRCESMSSSYTGHIPGFAFHSNGRTFGSATCGTKQYLEKCVYYNTFSNK